MQVFDCYHATLVLHIKTCTNTTIEIHNTVHMQDTDSDVGSHVEISDASCLPCVFSACGATYQAGGVTTNV